MSERQSDWNIEALPEIAPLVRTLPAFIDAEEFLKQELEVPAELVQGFIHRNTLAMIGGPSKAHKTFTVLDLALSVSQGAQWWGRDVAQGPVLYLNFEVGSVFFQRRLEAIADAKSLCRPLRNLAIGNLRGYATDIARLAPEIVERCKGKDYAMIIIDPIYKLLGKRSENSNDEMAGMLNHFEEISEGTGGAAVVFCHHFTKGSASTKAQIDRVSGGGVFGRQPDSIITLTPHIEQGAFVVEATLRNFAPSKPFCLRWEYPLLDFAHELDPKQLAGKAGAKAKYSVQQVVSVLSNGMTTGEWKAAALEQLGCAASTFAALKKQAAEDGLVAPDGKRWLRKPKVISFNPMTGESKVTDRAAAVFCQAAVV